MQSNVKRRDAIKAIGATATLGVLPGVGTSAWCVHYCEGECVYPDLCEDACGGCTF